MMKRLLFGSLILILAAHGAYAEITVLGGLTREITAGSGERIEGTIELANNGDEVAHVDIYQTDYMFFADGRTSYDKPGSTFRSNAEWLSLSPSRVAVPAKGTASIYYQLTVPDNPGLNGSYWSIVMIEPVSNVRIPKISEKAGEISMGIRTVVRYAIQIITNMGESGTSSIQVTGNRLLNENGKTMLEMDIENNGERWLSPTVWAELYGKNGTYIGRFEGERKRIMPSCSVRHRLALAEVPKGSYTVLMIADNGDDRVFGTAYEVRLE
jgi:hypothetical protein